jgi:hypothetical protein
LSEGVAAFAQLGAQLTNSPETYMLDGHQYLLVAAADTLFAFYLQGGLIDVGFLGAAQIDRFGNINTTVIGDYDHPTTRLPGSGGACEIAINARQVFVIMRQSARSFVETIDFPETAEVFLETLLGSLRVCYMKGRGNYLCRKKLYDLADQPILNGLEEISHPFMASCTKLLRSRRSRWTRHEKNGHFTLSAIAICSLAVMTTQSPPVQGLPRSTIGG